jgi:acyl-CoA dehydrogenase
MARSLLAAQDLRDADPSFYDAKITTARFFAENLLPQAQALAISIIESGHSTNALEVEQF